ncbi:MAG TPA: ATP-binding protein [Chthoniobacterales bacterium]
MSQTQAAEQILKSDDALSQREEHFDALVSGVEDFAIFLLSPEGNVISWNAGAQRIKGYKPEEIIGKHFSVFYPQEAIERGWPGNGLRLAAKEGRFTAEGWRVRKDGSRFWGSVVITALRAQNGAVRGFLKITRDLTERRKIEALQEADRLKDNFLATLSHEFRTHLNAILGWTGLMKESLDDAAVISKGLDVLERNTKTLTGLIADLVDISKITAGTLTLDFEEVDLKQVVSSSVETLRVQAAEKGIALESFVETGIDCGVWADEVRLHQILANILSNSLKFTAKGGSVSVQLRKTQATAILLVKDTGEGISPEFLPYIFEQFAQAKSTRSENRGMGLGLAICKHLVELHHGSISAESEGLGCGTTVKVELPLTASSSPARFEQSRQHAFTEEGRMRNTRLGCIKVLAVDDDADSRDLLKAILERSGANTTVLGSGKEALEVVKNSRPDVLICDLAMPQMDGYELLKNVRRLEPEIGWLPVIAFTASVRNEDRAHSRDAGFQAHLEKPLIPNELVTTIIELVGQKTRDQ